MMVDTLTVIVAENICYDNTSLYIDVEANIASFAGSFTHNREASELLDIER